MFKWVIDITKYVEEIINEAFEKADQEGYTMSKWISCKEQMPEDNVPVLYSIRTESGMQAILYGWHYRINGLGGAWHQAGVGGARAEEDVTHWQYLPKPPKEREQNDT